MHTLQKNHTTNYKQNSPITIIDIGTARIIPTNTVQPTETTQQHPNTRYIPELEAIRSLKPLLRIVLPPGEYNKLEYGCCLLMVKNNRIHKRIHTAAKI